MRILFLPALLGAFSAPTGARDADEAEAVAELASRGEEVRLIDVRTQREYDAGHLDGAEHIDFMSPDFRTRVDELPRDAPYRLYCRSGNRSGKAARVLSAMGFTDAVNIGGYERLVTEGAPASE